MLGFAVAFTVPLIEVAPAVCVSPLANVLVSPLSPSVTVPVLPKVTAAPLWPSDSQSMMSVADLGSSANGGCLPIV